jgi:acetoin utilization deacetylase AcuC-like enzyme
MIIFSKKFYNHNNLEQEENAKRLDWCLEAVKGFGGIEIYEPKLMNEKILLLGHKKEYIQMVKNYCSKSIPLDEDTYTTT